MALMPRARLRRRRIQNRENEGQRFACACLGRSSTTSEPASAGGLPLCLDSCRRNKAVICQITLENRGRESSNCSLNTETVEMSRHRGEGLSNPTRRTCRAHQRVAWTATISDVCQEGEEQRYFGICADSFSGLRCDWETCSNHPAYSLANRLLRLIVCGLIVGRRCPSRVARSGLGLDADPASIAFLFASRLFLTFLKRAA